MFAMFPLGGVGIIMLLLFFIPFGLLLTAFWIWMLVDAAKNKGLEQNEKIIWIIVIALLHWLGAIVYFFAGRPKQNTAARTQTN
jgi:hypothetical protein